MVNKLFLTLCLLAFISCETPVFEVNTEGHSANAFTVKKGLQFKLKLAGNPTTGYSWFLLNLKSLSESKFVSNVDTNEDGSAGGYVQKENVDENEEPIDGAGGDFYFTFEAVAKTSEPVNFLFSYQKPWEGINDVANAVKVEITVK